MAESKLLTNEEIMDFAGQTNYATTRTYYIFSELTPEDRKEAYEKVFCKSVTNCNKTAWVLDNKKALKIKAFSLKSTAEDGT